VLESGEQLRQLLDGLLVEVAQLNKATGGDSGEGK
jgi:hypothetical protein